MVSLTVFGDYLCWHYSRAFVDIFHIWRDSTNFIFNFFSISLLFRTFFAPWKRLEAAREVQGFDLQDYLSTKLVNVTMRIVGAIMRSFLIVVGLCSVAFVVVLGGVFFVFWILLPVFVFVIAAAGVRLLVLG